MRIIKTFIPLLFLIFIPGHSETNDLKIFSQKSGPWQTNCYLLYDMSSKDAAIIDVGLSMDTIVSCIENNGLNLKYVFLTHAHQDHIAGLPEMLKRFPNAKFCVSEKEFEDRKMYAKWRDIFTEKDVAAWGKEPMMVKLMDFDYSQIPSPDILVTENTEFKLGKFTIRSIILPGHSRGSTGYYLNNLLFSGDLILYHSVGYLDYKLGSKEKLIRSVKRLYKLFSDETIIHSGHGAASTIGYEKKSNKVVTQDGIKW